jgi:hypothetical protein
MSAAFSPVLWASCLLGLASGPEASGSFLYRPAYCIDDVLRLPAEAYLPQPGDIMLATDPGKFWTVTHAVAGAGHPHNSAIIFARPDGSLAILEAGPYDTLYIRSLDMLPHLCKYEAKGPVWIRRRRVPLTVEQSARLTEFAVAQDGKRFALIRLAGQLTLLRCRGPLRTYLLGKPNGHRDAYFCSELVTEACVYAGLIDPANARPAATYPCDLFFDRSNNLFLHRHFKLAPCWDPPARWTPSPVQEPGPCCSPVAP